MDMRERIMQAAAELLAHGGREAVSTRAVSAAAGVHPTTMADAPAARDDLAILHGLVARAAEAGRLQVSVPHAVRLLAAAGIGVTLSLIATPPEARDLRLSTAMREAVFAAITIVPTSDGAPDGAPGPERVAARAVALRAVLAEAPGVLSLAERHLLGEWLDRLAGADS